MPHIDRKKTLRQLRTTELVTLVQRWGLPGDDSTPKQELVRLLAENEATTLAEMLLTLPRVRLKELCRARGLDDRGRRKSEIVSRLLELDRALEEPVRPVPPIRRRARAQDRDQVPE